MLCFLLFTKKFVGMRPKDDYVKLVVVGFKLGLCFFLYKCGLDIIIGNKF